MENNNLDYVDKLNHVSCNNILLITTNQSRASLQPIQSSTKFEKAARSTAPSRPNIPCAVAELQHL